MKILFADQFLNDLVIPVAVHNEKISQDEEYHTLFSNSVFIKAPGAGHFIWMDNPGVCAAEIEKFLLD
jgi:pimeloyl-ACP methyl ester carboxylesterase